MEYIKIDLHTHTTASPDGLSTPEMAVRAALKRGLRGIAVTDHNTNAAVAAVRAAAPPGFIVIPGVEYSTDCGHALALFCEPLFDGAAWGVRVPLAALSVFVKLHGGLLVLAHPFKGRDALPEAVFAHAQGLEAVNARALARDMDSPGKVRAAAQAGGLFTTGGSDAHTPWEIGGAYTLFPSGMDLKEALLSGACRAEGQPGKRLYWAMSRVVRKIRLTLCT